MARLAYIDENNVVTRVILGEPDFDTTAIVGDEQVSEGFTYVPETNMFYPPQPHPSWTMSPDSPVWEAPVPKPEVGVWTWEESTLTWVEVDVPKVYRSITRLEFEVHVQTAAGLTDAEFLAALQDPDLALLWHRLSIATSVDRDSDLTQNGLTSMVSAGHLTDAQVTLINDTWP